MTTPNFMGDLHSLKLSWLHGMAPKKTDDHEILIPNRWQFFQEVSASVGLLVINLWPRRTLFLLHIGSGPLRDRHDRHARAKARSRFYGSPLRTPKPLLSSSAPSLFPGILRRSICFRPVADSFASRPTRRVRELRARRRVRGQLADLPVGELPMETAEAGDARVLKGRNQNIPGPIRGV